MTCDHKEVPCLNDKVKAENGRMTTGLYIRPMDRNSLLDFRSAHLRAPTESLPGHNSYSSREASWLTETEKGECCARTAAEFK
ncbi:hypothetical protein NDU88_001447 [Pleurodeles waltl]|uniref:Uncharacterized protein n=1 Tax=Pleurodeles waltl TaxID=8319 RepID=A0AAV7KS22_PLEWA|nr:hypothetical protein NDU88_001447 [Pleurodeles waltl]